MFPSLKSVDYAPVNKKFRKNCEFILLFENNALPLRCDYEIITFTTTKK